MPTAYKPIPTTKAGEELSPAAEDGAMELVVHKDRSVLAELKMVLNRLITTADLGGISCSETKSR